MSKKIVGYKLHHACDNGEVDEYHRIFQYESEIFVTRDSAEKSRELIKKSLIRELKQRWFYDADDLKRDQEKILQLVEKLEVIPVYARYSPCGIFHQRSFD